MISFFKDKITAYLIDRQLRQKNHSGLSFTNFFSDSTDFFVIMRADDKDFNQSFEVLNFLEANKKNVLIFIHDFRVSLMPVKYRQHVFVHSITDTNKLNLPSKNIQNKLNEMKFDASIDLNRTENLFSSFTANLVQAKVRIGFTKPGSDKFYNLQIANNEDQSDLSYKNLLNCLGMF